MCRNKKKDSIEVKQEAYVKKVLKQFAMEDCNSSKYPMEAKLQLRKNVEGSLVDPKEYRHIIECLRYLTHTRPDISYVVDILRSGREVEELVGFTDSDLAGDIDDRKSTGGMVFYLNGNLITWQSQKQRTIVLSSCEAEFMAATAASCQGLWLRNLLSEVLGCKTRPVTLYADNKSAI
ncbi:secreted RxLR effector protein 161-like [Impatiens glandulifera]|uniref:secreted RxLR effector protein 161-like n=1 Tax=Impatiens glandulifera TaxID=253017 RepID=UPI001FB07E33|nr:secreted RxLR effector protein 161-like [Impatiens glandulifera]